MSRQKPTSRRFNAFLLMILIYHKKNFLSLKMCIKNEISPQFFYENFFFGSQRQQYDEKTTTMYAFLCFATVSPSAGKRWNHLCHTPSCNNSVLPIP